MRRTAIATVFVLMLLCATWAQAQMYCTPPVLGDIAIAEETAGFSVDVKYPVLCSQPATRAIRDHVTRFLSRFKLEFPEHDLREYPHKHQVLTDYSVWTTGHGQLISVKLAVSVFTGGAHPNHWPDTMVFNMVDGSRIRLTDLFTNTPSALAKLAPMVREVLAESLGQMLQTDMLMNGTDTVPCNYSKFILTEEGIAFFFSPYQVAPYAAGEQAVTIPWSVAGPLVRPEILTMIQD